MDSSTIDRKALASRTVDELRALPTDLFHSVLLRYCADLTISARMHFVDERFQAARDCNETLHRILGFLANELGGKASGAKDSMIEMVVAGAEHQRRLSMLRKALEMVHPRE